MANKLHPVLQVPRPTWRRFGDELRRVLSSSLPTSLPRLGGSSLGQDPVSVLSRSPVFLPTFPPRWLSFTSTPGLHRLLTLLEPTPGTGSD